MSGETDTADPPAIPKLGLAGAAILGALCMYFAVLLVLLLMDLVFASTWLLTPTERSNLGVGALGAVAFFGIFAVLPGGALRWVARRYQSPAVQAGALIGACGMSLVYLLKILFDPAVGSGPIVLLILLGLGLLVGVAGLSANPTREPGDRTGIDALRDSLVGGGQRLVHHWNVRSGTPSDPTPEPERATADEPTGSSPSVSTSRYWLVVGIAFVVCLPLAIVEPAFGIGLLSSFLTAYTFSKQIEAQSATLPDDQSSDDG